MLDSREPERGPVREIEQRAVAAYRSQFQEEPEVVASAPGRVNLIGEHTDYNAGFVFPCAIDRRLAIAAGRGDMGLYSCQFDELRSLTPQATGSWGDYPSGVAWAFTRAGSVLPPFQAALAGDVPVGKGLSSSAALEAATALALDSLFHLGLSRREMALLCQVADNLFVGIQSGIMDQFASLLCQEGTALLIDCRTLDARSVPLGLTAAGLCLLVCDTGAERHLVASGYNERRASCERAVAALGIESLRDATIDDLSGRQGEDFRRARHVISENERVLDAVSSLERRDFEMFGELMYASHASLRDDYEVSTPELDTFVEMARDAGALGARLTGAGFGGCAIALVANDKRERLTRACRQVFQERGFSEPTVYQVRPSAGAEIVL